MRVWFALIAATVVLEGCGPTCQSTCNRLYAAEECAIPTPGATPDDMYDQCVKDWCEPALDQPGVLGSYDPDARNSGSSTVDIVNERQAAAWMDCVAQTDCERINEGYCEPH